MSDLSKSQQLQIINDRVAAVLEADVYLSEPARLLLRTRLQQHLGMPLLSDAEDARR